MSAKCFCKVVDGELGLFLKVGLVPDEALLHGCCWTRLSDAYESDKDSYEKSWGDLKARRKELLRGREL